MEVESLGEAEPECIEFEEQRAKVRSQQEEEGLRKGRAGRGGMWRKKTKTCQCQGSLEEPSSVKRSKLCSHGSESFLSFGGFKFHVLLGIH